jgi:hypothetical protein
MSGSLLITEVLNNLKGKYPNMQWDSRAKSFADGKYKFDDEVEVAAAIPLKYKNDAFNSIKDTFGQEIYNLYMDKGRKPLLLASPVIYSGPDSEGRERMYGKSNTGGKIKSKKRKSRKSRKSRKRKNRKSRR